MQFLIAFVITLIFSYAAAGIIRKHPLPFYIAGALISAAAASASILHLGNDTLKKYLISPFSGGAFAGAFWAVIMLIGALPAGGKLIKRLMPARGELSIFAAAVTLSHIITYAVTYIKRLISPDLRATGDFVITCIVSLLLVLIMLPLTVISFKKIRARFKGKTWKNIQRTAYVFYALIYIHVMVIFIPRARLGQSDYYLSCIAYTAVWSTYFVLRARKAYLKNKKPEKKALLNTACTAAALLCTGVIAFAGYGEEQTKLETAEPIVVSTKDSPVVFTAAAAQNEETQAPDTADTVETAEISQEEVTQPSEQAEQKDDKTSKGSVKKSSKVTGAKSGKASSSTKKTTMKNESGNTETEASGSQENDVPDTQKAKPAAAGKDINTQTKATTRAADVKNTGHAAGSTTKATSAAASPAQTSAATTAATAAKTTAGTTVKTTAKPTTTTPKPVQTTTTTTTAAPVYKYNNGTYSDKAYGYDGYIHVTITIENDVITSFSAYTEEESEEDQAYFNMAYGPVGQAIINEQTNDVDGVSGATISSDAIKMATKKCLKQALR